MTIRKSVLITALAVSAAVFTAPGAAIEVFQWIDRDGVVHFSQWAPSGDVEDYQRLQIAGDERPDNGIGVGLEDDPEGYRAHETAMQALWDDIEARREAGREYRESAPEPAVIYREPYAGYAYPFGFPAFPGRPVHKPPFRPPQRPPRPPMDEEPAAPVSHPYKRP